ncbi:MAG TPA: hypothetical protein VM345_20265 [Acidimicrobiales bacterium]|jgi:hypothetical protein|nr:hypothetical protein [Acidimicrobiales bacterium]
MITLKAVRHLRPTVDIDGPRVRLGVIWAAIAFSATALGPTPAALVFAAVALGAAGQACRAWRRQARRPYRPVAIVGAVVIALSSVAGPIAVTAAAVVTAIAAVTAAQLQFGQRAWDAPLTIGIALVAGIAAAVVPLARGEVGAAAALVLLLTVFAAEASWFLIGAGARRSIDAPIASSAAVLVVSILVAAVLVPPFRGASPWLLGAIAALLAPLGPFLASAVLPRPDAFAPALRRIDGFALVGPMWVLVASAVLDLR